MGPTWNYALGLGITVKWENVKYPYYPNGWIILKFGFKSVMFSWILETHPKEDKNANSAS